MLFSKYLKLARFHQPIGISLVFLPCIFGFLLAFKKSPNPDFGENLFLLLMFFLGSVLMRSAGCVINDLLDHKFDAQVLRTKNRPIASGEISIKNALFFLSFLLTLSLIILLQFNLSTIISGFFILALVFAYPLMKRITYYPQIFLGITFNFGLLMFSLAALNEISYGTFMLYLALIIWTLIYDTIYAYQDLEDDLKIGVKSTAVKFGKDPQKSLQCLNLLMFFLLITCGFCEHLSWQYFALIFVNFFYAKYQINNCNFKDTKNCLKTFKLNWVNGLIIASGIFLG